VALCYRPRASVASSHHQRHITTDATEILCGGPHKISKSHSGPSGSFVTARHSIGCVSGNRSLALLRRMFNIARADGKIQFVSVIRLLKEPPPRKGFVTRAQFEKLLPKLPAHLRPLVTFLYYCGVRVGEATQIEWDQVDLQGALIRLESEQTKTSEARVVCAEQRVVREG
jgi:integrase